MRGRVKGGRKREEEIGRWRQRERRREWAVEAEREKNRLAGGDRDIKRALGDGGERESGEVIK